MFVIKTQRFVVVVNFTDCCDAVCGGTLIASNKAGQLFSHAKYGDNNYGNKEDCEWLILAEDDGYRVRFRFLTFEIEDERDCG